MAMQMSDENHRNHNFKNVDFDLEKFDVELNYVLMTV